MRILARAGIQPPPSFRQTYAWQHPNRARLPSFQRKLESSGLDKPFPHSGNDNRHSNPTRHPAKPAIPLPVGLSLLDSSLRWNDDGGQNKFVTIPIAPLPFPKKNPDPCPPSSFRRRPESSGLTSHSRRAGMTTQGMIIQRAIR